MRTRRAIMYLALTSVVLAGCTTTSNQGVTPTSPSVDGSGDSTTSLLPSDAGAVATVADELPCIGTEWVPVLPDKWVFEPFPVDTAVIVPCDEPHTGLRVTSWTSDTSATVATRPGTGVQQELQAMAPDRLRCSEAVATLLSSDRPSRFAPVLSYSADRTTAFCDVGLMNNEPIVLADLGYVIDAGRAPFALLPSSVGGILSGTLWQGYGRCVGIANASPGLERIYSPNVCDAYAVSGGIDPRFVTEAGFLNPQGADPFPGTTKATRMVTAKCGPGPHSVPDSIAWSSGGPYECWEQGRPRRTSSEQRAVPPPDPGTLVPGTCLDYTPVYAVSTVRAADRPVPCEASHTAVVVDSWPSYDLQELPPAGWVEPALLYDRKPNPDGTPSGPRVTGKQDQARCEDMAWSLAGRNQWTQGEYLEGVWSEDMRTTLAPRVLYLPDADGTVMARCDLANLAGPLPADVAGINLSDSWTRVAKCVRAFDRSDYPTSHQGAISDRAKQVLCADPGALAQTLSAVMPGPNQWPGRAAARRLARKVCGPDTVVAATGTSRQYPAFVLRENWQNGRRVVCGTPLAPNSSTSGATSATPSSTVSATQGQLTVDQVDAILLTTDQAAAALGMTSEKFTMDAAAPCQTATDYTECARSWWNSNGGLSIGAYFNAPQAAATQIISYATPFTGVQEPLAVFSAKYQADGFTIQSSSPTNLVAVRKAIVGHSPTRPLDGFDEMRIVTAVGQTIVVASCWAQVSQAWPYCAHSLSRAQLTRLPAQSAEAPLDPGVTPSTPSPVDPSPTAVAASRPSDLTAAQLEDAFLNRREAASALGISASLVEASAPGCQGADANCSTYYTFRAQPLNVANIGLVSYHASQDVSGIVRSRSELPALLADGWKVVSLSGTTLVMTRDPGGGNDAFHFAEVSTLVGSTLIVVHCTTVPASDSTTAVACAENITKAQVAKLN